MSCVDVMYQPYSPYFPYHQRSQLSVSSTVPQLTTPQAEYRPKFSSVKPQTDTSPSSAAGSPAECRLGGGDQQQDKEKAEAQYLSANCVLFTYYSGDISAVVDEHFARALSTSYAAAPETTTTAATSKGHAAKDGPPMSHRNFPPSFWNSNYQPMSNSNLSSMGPGALGSLPPDLTYGGDPYHHHPVLHHQNDPWYHTLAGHQSTHFGHHRSHELTYPGMSTVTGASRFTPQYGSLLLQPTVRSAARLGPAAAACASLEKSESWGTSRYHDPIMDSNYGAAYGAMTPMPGLEGQPQDSKEIYWF